ncbi:MAG: Maf family protein [Candidatus Dojkabacteria bacterium]
MHIILASSSPRRKKLLSKLVSNFDSISPEIDETPLEGENARYYVQRLATEKAQAVWDQIKTKSTQENTVIIAGDTTVDLNGAILSKAVSDAEATSMITSLSGRSHFVHTGVSVLLNGNFYLTAVVSAEVRFRELSDEEISTYISEKIDWGDKAGAYAVQGEAKKFVEYVKSDYDAVVGLPTEAIKKTLHEIIN